MSTAVSAELIDEVLGIVEDFTSGVCPKDEKFPVKRTLRDGRVLCVAKKNKRRM